LLLGIPLIELRALLLIRFPAPLVRLLVALAGLTARLVLLRGRHCVEVPCSKNQIKRQDFAMFAMESRCWLVPCAALMWLGTPVAHGAGTSYASGQSGDASFGRFSQNG
jgi:hypothetical protein